MMMFAGTTFSSAKRRWRTARLQSLRSTTPRPVPSRRHPDVKCPRRTRPWRPDWGSSALRRCSAAGSWPCSSTAPAPPVRLPSGGLPTLIPGEHRLDRLFPERRAAPSGDGRDRPAGIRLHGGVFLRPAPALEGHGTGAGEAHLRGRCGDLRADPLKNTHSEKRSVALAKKGNLFLDHGLAPSAWRRLSRRKYNLPVGLPAADPDGTARDHHRRWNSIYVVSAAFGGTLSRRRRGCLGLVRRRGRGALFDVGLRGQRGFENLHRGDADAEPSPT